MHYTADPMFPGDLLDAASRFAADSAGIVARKDAWRQVAAMGWPALLVDESCGGAGGSLSDLGAVIEGCARHSLGLPLVRRCAQVPALLMGIRNEAAQGVLKALCSGEMDIDIADATALQAQPLADGGVRLSGRLERVDAELPHTHVLVAAGEYLLLLPRALLPAPEARYIAIDGALGADYVLADFVLPPSAVLLSGSQTGVAVAAAEDLATFATGIEMAATLGASVERCIEYLSTRVQFGVALATFQALRHKVVELYVDYESASVLLARLAQDAIARGHLATRDVALCKLYLNTLARRGAEASIQLHGGMGMTAELPATRLACRLLCAEFDYGDRQQQLARLQPPSRLAVT